MQKVIPNTRPTRDGNSHRSRGWCPPGFIVRTERLFRSGATLECRQPVNSWGRSQKSGMWHRPGSTANGCCSPSALRSAERSARFTSLALCPNHGAFDVEAIRQRRNPQARNRPQNRLNRLWIIGTNIGDQFEALLGHVHHRARTTLYALCHCSLAIDTSRAGRAMCGRPPEPVPGGPDRIFAARYPSHPAATSPRHAGEVTEYPEP